ncbi:MAG: hypothetical protein ACE5GA_01180 [Candidatus Zixiibacteriota bacterium]
MEQNTPNPWDDAYDGADIGDGSWITLGRALDRVTAGFVIETLQSYEIPAMMDSKSGYLGDVGLTAISSVFENPTGAYEIRVPAECAEEALGIAEMVGGGQWEPADNS